MKFKALVVDDDADIREAVADILASLGHEYDAAATQEDARKMLRAGKYDYVLLDLQIPVKKGGYARIQNGINLLREIRQTPGMESTPVVVMTGHGKDSPELAVQVMKCGAVDYVTKPFPSAGETLDKRILEAIKARESGHAQADALRPAPAKLEPFSRQKRQIIIYLDRITVCGIELWSDKGVPDLREALILLAEREDGGYVRIKGPALMKKMGRDPSNPIARPIKDFCDKATELLALHRGLACGRYDVIDSRGGYHLTDWIEVKTADDEAHEPHGTENRHEPHREPHEPDGEPHEPHADTLKKTLSVLPSDQSERLVKVCHSLASKSLNKEEIRRLSGVSRAQNTRDLKALSDFQLVLRSGPQKQRIYRLAACAMSLICKKP
jgi:CheY-like chemotaxis protein